MMFEPGDIVVLKKRIEIFGFDKSVQGIFYQALFSDLSDDGILLEKGLPCLILGSDVVEPKLRFLAKRRIITIWKFHEDVFEKLKRVAHEEEQ